MEIDELGRIIGRGRMAEVYNMDNDKVLKLFYSKYRKEVVAYEFEICETLDKTDITSPEVYNLVTYKGRYGFVMEKIAGDTLVNKIPSKFYRVKSLGREFAELQLSFHQHTHEDLPLYHDYLEDRIKHLTHLTSYERDLILNHLNLLESGNVICHADYHPDNVMLENNNMVAIDWIDAKQGHPLFDIARTMMLLKYSSPDTNFVMKLLIGIFRKLFYSGYIEIIKKHTPYTEEDIERYLLPILTARLSEGILSEKDTILEQVKQRLIDLQ